MAQHKDIADYIKKTEYYLAKYKAVQSVFPLAKTNGFMEFCSKEVNLNYTELAFEERWNGLYVLPFSEIDFQYDNKIEIIKIHSSPLTSKLVQLNRWRNKDGDQIMKFGRLKINLKNNKFSDKMIDLCREKIVSFIKSHSEFKIDDKHMDPRLKKLMLYI